MNQISRSVNLCNSKVHSSTTRFEAHSSEGKCYTGFPNNGFNKKCSTIKTNFTSSFLKTDSILQDRFNDVCHTGLERSEVQLKPLQLPSQSAAIQTHNDLAPRHQQTPSRRSPETVGIRTSAHPRFAPHSPYRCKMRHAGMTSAMAWRCTHCTGLHSKLKLPVRQLPLPAPCSSTTFPLPFRSTSLLNYSPIARRWTLHTILLLPFAPFSSILQSPHHQR